LGILPDQRFVSSTLHLEPGDILAIVSDGFTETFNSKGREFGMTGIEEIVHGARNRELREISAELRSRVREYGEQRDDQTILLVRRLA
jgi:serine phosphatase RsbU (regulator of sigma subunit)